MQWKPNLALIPPAGVGELADGLSTFATAANSALDLADTAITAVQAFITLEADPAASAATALATTIQGLINDMFATGGYVLVAHPYQSGVGKGKGAFVHLPFPDLVTVMAQSFDDQGDIERPYFSTATEVELVSIVIGAPSPSLFRDLLKAFNAFFSIQELQLAARRIEQLLELEKDRFQIVQGSRPPDWNAWALRDIKPMGELEQTLGEQADMLVAYAKAGESSLDVLSALIAKKKAQLTTMQTRLDTLIAALNGGIENAGIKSGYARQFGTKALQDEFKTATDGAGPELSFCAGVCFVAPYPALVPLKEALQL